MHDRVIQIPLSDYGRSRPMEDVPVVDTNLIQWKTGLILKRMLSVSTRQLAEYKTRDQFRCNNYEIDSFVIFTAGSVTFFAKSPVIDSH